MGVRRIQSERHRASVSRSDRTRLFPTLFAFTVLLHTCLALNPSIHSGPPAAGLNAKLVFAHFIAGLTINYTREDWQKQINLAASHSIDAFALNVGTPATWQLDQVTTAYEIASNIKTASEKPFKMFLSLDMSVIKSSEEVTQWVTKFTPLPAQLLIEGRPLISTFAGEDNNLGGGSLSDGWQAAVKDPLLNLTPPLNALLVPAWTSLDPTSAVTQNPVIDGIMTWLSWPTGKEKMGTMVDLQFQRDAQKSEKLYMAGVSPCFFTHYPEKNYLFRSDDHLYITRWKELITMQRPPDFIQIISWNDYGESHYIGPNTGSVPDGTTWVEGFDHQAWLAMTDYFIQWYKKGSPPAITDERVYFHYRPHSVNAVASFDPLGPPKNASATTDAIYISTFLAHNSTAQKLIVTVGDNAPQTFENPPLGDIGTFSVPWTGAGGGVDVKLMDTEGKKLLTGRGSVEINNHIERYNFNYAHTVLAKTDPLKLPGSGLDSSSGSASPSSSSSKSAGKPSILSQSISLSASAITHALILLLVL